MEATLKESLQRLGIKCEGFLRGLEEEKSVRVGDEFRAVLGVLMQGGKAEMKVEVLKEICWEKLHTGHWADVPDVWRDAYALAQLMGVYGVLIDGMREVDARMKELDLGLMMGGDLFRPELETMMQKLGSLLKKRSCEFAPSAPKRTKLDDDELPVGSLKRPPGRSPPVERSPSLDDFCERYLKDVDSSQPCILKELATSWPAFHKWQRLDYFHESFGHRTIPVEIGQHYLAEKWGQEMMTLTEFLTRYMTPDGSSETVGYLAQHPLFDQISELRDDICIPEYCSLDSDSKEPAINAWFGPRGTVSPLHYDNSHNILAQVVGRKYVRLYAPSQSARLHPIPVFMNRNSSQIDLDNLADVKKFKLEEVEFVDVILDPGDGLFIPRGWWHYVRSLDISFSVSFWWCRLLNNAC